MNCPVCGNECPAEDRFCSVCGNNLGGEESTSAGDQLESELDVQGQIAVLRETLNKLATQVTQIAERVNSLEGGLFGTPQASQPAPTATANLVPSGNVAYRASPTMSQHPLGRVVPQYRNRSENNTPQR